MIELLKQELKFSPLCLLCLAGGWAAYLLDRRSAVLYPQAAYMLGFFLVAGVVAAVINRELKDTFGGGYGLLRRLPVTDAEIVQAKFVAALMDVVFSWLLVFALFAALPAESGILQVNLAYMTLWSLGVLALVSVWHSLVYRFGFVAPTLVLTLILLGVLLPGSLILDQGFDFTDTLGFPPLIHLLASAHWTIWVFLAGLTLFLCFGLFRLAVHWKKTKETF
jgi:hypothetical protein